LLLRHQRALLGISAVVFTLERELLPPMPPASLVWRIASSMPFIQVLPNRASEFVSGPALPITRSAAFATPASASTRAAAEITVTMRMLMFPLHCK
jgi:hypothetical protein